MAFICHLFVYGFSDIVVVIIIIIIKLNCQSEVGVLRVKNEKFSKITLTKNGGKYYGYSGEQYL